MQVRSHKIDTVYELAHMALVRILKTSFHDLLSNNFDRTYSSAKIREAIANQYQTYWNEYKSTPLVERWYKTLLDDKAGIANWLQALENIIQAESRENPKYQGESLRQGHEPTVSALLARRIDAMLKRNSNDRNSLDYAINLAGKLVTWDPAAAVPPLREVCRVLRVRFQNPDNGNSHASQQLAVHLAKFTLDRFRAGDADALPEYAAWVRTVTPNSIEKNQAAALEPLWRLPAQPVLAEAATWLFNDPASPWVPLISPTKQNSGYHEGSLIPSPLVAVPGFRSLLQKALTDKTLAGTASVSDQRGVQINFTTGVSTGIGSAKVDPLMPKPGEKVAFRMADYYGWKLAELEGSPPFELYWPEVRRDQGLVEMSAFLNRRGDRFAGPDSVADPYGEFHARSPFSPYARLTFPALDHPATREEVERGLAIFSNEGVGERRVVATLKRPLMGNWVTFHDFPSIQMPVDPKTGPITIYDQHGRFWQAEEVLTDGQWKRFYGFVGSHVIARVPAEEVEITDWPYSGTGTIPDGVDALFFGPAAQGDKTNHALGSPLLMTLRLENHSGLDRQAPVEFARKREDRVATLREGFDIKVDRAPEGTTWSQSRAGALKWEALTSRFDVHFKPEATTRTLRPAESFEPLVMDLNDWFHFDKPGLYRVSVSFAKDLGVSGKPMYPAVFAIGVIPPDPPYLLNNQGDSFE